MDVQVKRFQLMRSAKKGQQFGTRIEIRPLDGVIFCLHVLPRLRPGHSSRLAEYLAQIGDEVRCMMISEERSEDWQFAGVGKEADLLQIVQSSGWALKITNFTDPEALTHGAMCGDERLSE